MSELPPSVRRAAVKARAALLWEWAAPVIWPGAAFPALYLIGAFLGVWSWAGDPARALALIVTTGLGLALAVRGAIQSPWPRRTDVLRRVEADSQLAHRPFDAITDAPAGGDIATLRMWRAHQARMRNAVANARAKGPRAALAGLDPNHLRYSLALYVAGAGVLATGLGVVGPRLADSYALEPLRRTAGLAVVDAWVTPPDYTGAPPIFLGAAADAGAAPRAIVGAELTVRVSGASRRPRAHLITADGRNRLNFDADGPGAYVAKAPLNVDATVQVSNPGRTDWVVLVDPDAPPTAAWSEAAVDESPRQELMFSFSAVDDFPGVSAVLRLTEAETGDSLDVDLPAPGVDGAQTAARLDLVKHPLAGLEVEAAIVATDALGQTGVSETRAITLPDRLFLNPLAAAIAHERALFIRDDAPFDIADMALQPAGVAPPEDLPADLGYLRGQNAPASVRRTRDAFDLMLKGQAYFEIDAAVHLTMANVAERLARPRDRADLAGVDEVMWDLALKAEGGGLADARRAFEAARAALADALARGADAEEIERRVAAFKEAVQRYMTALTADALLNERFAEGDPSAQQGMTGGGINDALAALDDLSATGSLDDARKLLDELSDQIANMEVEITTGGGGGGEGDPLPIETDEVQEALGDLSDVIGEQRGLADETQNEQNAQSDGEQSGGQSQSGDDAQAGEPDGQTEGASGAEERLGNGGADGDLAARQRALADRLAGLQERLAEAEAGDLAGDLQAAEDAMREAARALENGDDAGAQISQGQALEGLRGAAERFAEDQLARRLAAEMLDPEDLPEDLDELAPIDPLGRATAGALGGQPGQGPDIPDAAQRERAREILEELRRRAGETDRSQEELGYIRRLLEIF